MSRTRSQYVSPIGILTANGMSITGVSTVGNVSIGAGNTALIVQGDVRITGILTVGTASITFDGNNNRINVGSAITFNGSTGIISATSFRGDGANLTGISAAFPVGTLMLFQQTTAPTGWTKETTHNNKALRVVSGSAGSGGSTAFTSVFTSRTPSGSVSVSGSNSGGSVTGSVSGSNSGGSVTGSVSGSNSGGSVTGSVSGSNSGGSVSATTLTTSEIPSHTHPMFDQTGPHGANQNGNTYGAVSIFDNNAGAKSTGATGGSGSHTHGFTNPSWSGSWSQSSFTNPSWSGSWSQSSFTNPSWSGSWSQSSFTNPTWSGSASFTGSALDFAVQYVDLIIASKN
jgi:hypothetical protein